MFMVIIFRDCSRITVSGKVPFASAIVAKEFFLGLNMFLFPNRIQFGSENFIEFFKIRFPDRIGIGSETDTV